MATLLEYVTNEVYTYRADSIHDAMKQMARRGGPQAVFALIQSIYVKSSEILDRPVKIQIDQDGKKQQNTELSRRIYNCLQILVEELAKMSEAGQIEFNYDNFTLVLQAFSHPLCSPNHRSLKNSFKVLEKQITEEKLQSLFEQWIDQMIEQFLKRRTGILSDNSTVQHIAKNMLVYMSWAGKLEQVVKEMVPIFEYKPIQMLYKMEALFKQEFDTISHYDLLFYSEMTKDLLRMFASRDETSIKVALRLPDDQGAEAEESKSPGDAQKAEEPQVKAELAAPVDLAAALKARAKKGKDKKKKKAKGKAPAPAATSKPAAASAPAAQAKSADAPTAPVETKEERNKSDRKQLLFYVEKLRQIKATHVSICQEALLMGNDCKLAERLNY